MCDEVLFYRDDTEESDQIERELQRRGLAFRTIWGLPDVGTTPAIETGGFLLSGWSNIYAYFFRWLANDPAPKQRVG